jgi:hypothetical protein
MQLTEHTSVPCPRGVPSESQKPSLNPLSDWIQSYQWDYFVTVTPRRPRRDSIAFLRDLSYNLKKGPSNCKRAFLAAEPFRFQHNLHVHGLVALGNENVYYGYSQPWQFEFDFRRQFGISRVEKIRGRHQVAEYCAKYVTKWGDGDNWDILGDYSQ